MTFAYADPPYFRMGKRMYGGLHSEAHIWDDKQEHINLASRLVKEYPDGWAMSCNPADLKWLLPSLPDDVRVAAWTKTFHQIRPTSVQFAWEPVLFQGGRKLPKRKPMVRDWLQAPRAMRKGVPGSKPQVFNHWILDLLGFDPEQDTVIDLFPGSNGMAMAIQETKLFIEKPEELT